VTIASLAQNAARTFIDALVDALRSAATYNKQDQTPPAAVLWPDGERQWEPLVAELRERLPLYVLGTYRHTERSGPAYWLRCVTERPPRRGSTPRRSRNPLPAWREPARHPCG